MARQVSLTLEVVDELIDLYKSLDQAAVLPKLPPEAKRDQGLWRRALAEAERELREQAKARSKMRTFPPSRKLAEWEREYEVQPEIVRKRKEEQRENQRQAEARFNEHVRSRAEDIYRQLDPAIAAADAERKRSAEGISATLKERVDWHRASLDQLSEKMGSEWVVAAVPTGASYRALALKELAAIRLRLEQQQEARKPESLIERLIASAEPPELTARELALLEAYLKQGVSLSQVQQEKQQTGRSQTWENHENLELIRDFNRNLLASGQRDAQVSQPATEAKGGVAAELAAEEHDPKMSPSVVRAKAAHEYALGNIPGADKLTVADLLEAVRNRLDTEIARAQHGNQAEQLQEFRDGLPDNAETFGKYLRKAGVRKYDKAGRRTSRSVRRKNEL